MRISLGCILVCPLPDCRGSDDCMNVKSFSKLMQTHVSHLAGRSTAKADSWTAVTVLYLLLIITFMVVEDL